MAGVLFCADAGASGEAGSSVSREWMPNIFDMGCLLSVQQVCAFSAQTIRIYSDGRYPVQRFLMAGCRSSSKLSELLL